MVTESMCCCSGYTPIGLKSSIGIISQALNEAKEKPALKVCYKEFKGELVKLERKEAYGGHLYDISIFDVEKKVTCSFTKADLQDLKFLGGAVSFGG